MLLGRGFESGNHMTSMGRFFINGSNLEPSAAEDMARERAAMLAVQKEMNEADEINLLEEEDMHVFDQEPLSDRFYLVSCNTCKKPIKASQYAAHAERCRSFMVDDGVLDKRPRKSRNAMLGDTEISSDETATDSMSEIQMGNLKLQKRSANGAEVRPRKLSVYSQRDLPDGAGEESTVSVLNSDGLKRRKQNISFTMEDLDVICGVPSPRSGAPCRQPLTCKSHSISSKRAVAGRRKPFDTLLQEMKENHSKKVQQAEIPRPLATKVYCTTNHQRMRAVITSMYRESLTRKTGLVLNEQLEPINPQQQMLMSFSKGLH